MSLTLRRRPATDEEVSRLKAATNAAERDAVIAHTVSESLQSNDFYLSMVDFGHQWLRTGAFLVGGQNGVDGYFGASSVNLRQCGPQTAHPDAWFIADTVERGLHACSNLSRDGLTPENAPTRQVVPWWRPSASVTLVGDAALGVMEVIDANGVRRDCGMTEEGYFDRANPDGCGCGPNAVWCYPEPALWASHDLEPGQRRAVWDEPARLVGHLAWHDRPLSDLVLGNYTVANNRMRAWYLRFGRETGLYNAKLDGNSTWFRPEVGSLPRDPIHTEPTDTEAWRELVVEELAPQLVSLSNGARSADPTRTLTYDGRTERKPLPGLPAAGVFTMPGSNSTFSRERPRAARFLEIFACRKFNPPPPELHYPELGRDIATSGQCMHCHVLMDPVAMAFKRWIFYGYRQQSSHIAGLEGLRVPSDLYAKGNSYKYWYWFFAGADRWRLNWLPNTVLTPVTEAQIAANPDARFFDTIPPEYSVLGQHADGTVGPLAFSKILVASGEFDRCAVRKLYERFIGSALDPDTDADYIEELAAQFTASDRKVRPFVAYLLSQPEFRRGLP